MKMSRLVRLAAAVVLLALGALVGAGFRTPAHADPTLLGWTSQADANPFDLVIDDAAGLSGVHPLVEADLPEDSSDYETGPFGHALASVFWPGAVAGNVGSLSGELPIPSQLAPLLSKLNDPVRAETFYPSGPAAATYPSGSDTGIAQMKSQATGTGVSAQAGLADVAVPGLFEVKGVHGATTATATSTAQARADSNFSEISLLGGLVDIGASSSSATATSDGVSPSGKSYFHMGAVTIAGHSVSFGSDGLVLGPASTGLVGALTAPTTALVQQIVSLLQLKIVPLPQTETSQAPAEEITSGGLQVSFALPSTASLRLDCSWLPAAVAQLNAVCTLPGLLQGASVTITIGRVTATAIATPPFSADLGAVKPGSAVSGGSAPALSAGSGSVSGGVASASSGSPAGTGDLSPVEATGRNATPAPGPTLSSPSRPAEAGATSPSGLIGVSLSSPVRAGLLVFLLLLAAIVGGSLVRVTRTLDQPVKSLCPLEDQP